MTALLAIPILVPLLGAALSIGFGRSRNAQRVIGVVALAVVTVSSVVLLVRVDRDGIASAQAGEWEAPVGITFVADRLAAIMLTVAALMLLTVLVYAIGHPGAERTHAYTPAFSTPDYTPPELLWAEIGERGRRIRPSADVWAFGVLAHLVLTGSFPLPGATPTARRDAAVAHARGTAELRLSPELPDAWREIVHACLARTHAARISTEALLRRVETVTDTASAEGRSRRLARLPSGRLTHALPGRLARRTAVLAAGLATAAVAGLGYTVATWDFGSARGAAAGGAAADTGVVPYGAEHLRTDRGVPGAYRLLIVETAHDCDHPSVTPALIAAMLKVESDFDPDLADPGKDEYGIARWTPRVLRWWMNEDGTPGETVPSPPFPPAESIPAMGRYLCWIAPRLASDNTGDPRVLVAVAYRTSWDKVNKSGGVPAPYRAYAKQVAHYLDAYTPPDRAPSGRTTGP